MIQIYDKNTTDFSKNGRVLQDTLSCYVTEGLNGAYELELEHPIDGKWQELVEGNIIKADGQLFRIYNKQKTLARIKVNARHIFYDLYDNFLEDVRPENQSGIGALDWILTHTQYPHPFTCTGDVDGSNTRYFVRKNVVEAIMGQDGILETWGGEIERDNFIIKYKQARGMDRGVHVRYGKNIIGIEETINIDTVCTRMMPIGKDGLLLPEKYIDSPYINNYPHPKIRVYEFNDCETVEQLRATAQEFMEKNKIDIPPVNYKVDFLELSKTEEYKNYQVLERVYLGDTVTIKHSKLNIDLKCKVIKIKKNILTDRIEEAELGNFRNNFANALSTISNKINALKEIQASDKTALQQAIDNATQLLTSKLSGYVLKRENELLIMDTPDINTAQKVWRWNLNGLGYSSTGINGPYGLAMTMDGRIVADFITAGTLEGSLIKAGTVKLTALELDAQTKINKVDTLESDVNTLKTDNETYKSNITTLQTQVTAIAGEINTKVSQTDFDNLKNRVSSAESSITQLSDSINLKVDKNGIVSAINMSPEEIKIQSNKISITPSSGNNLILNSGFEFGTSSWSTNNNPTINTEQNWQQYNGKSAWVQGSTYGSGIFQRFYGLTVGKKYTVSFVAMIDGTKNGNTSVGIEGVWTINLKDVMTWTKYQYTFTATDTSHVFIAYANANGVAFFIDNIKVEEGEFATAWCLNENEIKNSVLEVTNDRVRFTSSDGSYTEFTPQTTGLKWYKAGTGRDYHYLSHIGEYTLGTADDWEQRIHVVQLPDEFKGKKFVVMPAITNIQYNYNNLYFEFVQICLYYANIVGYDYDNGTFTVCSQVITSYRDGAGNITQARNAGHTISYIAIA